MPMHVCTTYVHWMCTSTHMFMSKHMFAYRSFTYTGSATNRGTQTKAACQSLCDADAACNSIEVNGCLANGCTGTCWTYSGTLTGAVRYRCRAFNYMPCVIDAVRYRCRMQVSITSVAMAKVAISSALQKAPLHARP